MTVATIEDDLVITRTFAATRRATFAAWSDAAQMARWIGGEGFTAPVVERDFRVGGAHRTCIRSSDCTDYWWGGRYLEIIEPERLSFSVETYGWPGERTLLRAPHSRISILFEAAGEGSTTMTFCQSPLPPNVDRDNHRNGWQEAFDKLERHLGTLEALGNRATQQ
jgi:uncharacterized protein YndB with AHSA1/START domain